MRLEFTSAVSMTFKLSVVLKRVDSDICKRVKQNVLYFVSLVGLSEISLHMQSNSVITS